MVFVEIGNSGWLDEIDTKSRWLGEIDIRSRWLGEINLGKLCVVGGYSWLVEIDVSS